MPGPVAAPNAAAVFAGGPDKVTGAVLSAPIGTPVPTSIAGTLDSAFVDNGFVSEDGLKLSQDLSFEDIKEWGGSLVRSIQSDFSPTFSFTLLETTSKTAKVMFGDAAVASTAATGSVGNLLTITGSAEQADPRCFVFRMKDGPRKTMIVVEIGQVTDRGDISYTKTGAVTYEVTLKAIPNAAGVAFKIYTDDGVFPPIVAAGATAGIPGSVTPAGAAAPATLAALVSAALVASPLTAWVVGSYIVLGNGSVAHWNGTTWVQGSAAGVA